MINPEGKIRRAGRENLFCEKRRVFVAGDSVETGPKAVAAEETVEQRKKQARAEIDGVFESGEMDTYNIRKLPEEFKSLMKENFGQWVDSNIAKYDKNNNSGIDAEEYRTFQKELNTVVEGVMYRLAEIKREKTEAAEAMQETAEQVQEKQRRLEGVDVTTLEAGNLEDADGIYTELLKYQKDFENEGKGFGELAGMFSTAKDTVEKANQPTTTGVSAIGEYARNHPVIAGTIAFPGVGTIAGVAVALWAEDTPEVDNAKKAKEKAVEDLRTRVAEMRTRQKARQERGKTLNGAPENVKGKIKKEYGDKKGEVETAQKAVLEKRSVNAGYLEKSRKDQQLVSDSRATLQKSFEKIVSTSIKAAQNQQQTQDRAEEIDKAAEGIKKAEEVYKNRQAGMPGVGATANIPTQSGGTPMYLQLEKARLAAAKAQKEIGKTLKDNDIEIEGLESSSGSIQSQIVKLAQHSGILGKAVSDSEKTDLALSADLSELEKIKLDLTDEEQGRVAQIGELDGAIASTVLEVDTANFELIKKGEGFLSMLNGMSVSGPGLIDTVGATLNGIPGVGTAYNWSSAKLSAGWEWCKGAPVLGSVIGAAKWVGGKWVAGWDEIGTTLSWVGDNLHLQDAWDWMSKASRILENTSNPVLSWAGGFGGTVIEVFAGVTEGAKDLVKGIGMMVRNPIDLIKGLGALVNHPEMIIDALIQKDKWGNESAGKVIGRILLDVIMTCTGTGATATGVKTALAAVKIGEMTAGRAILLGIETFGRAFIKDLGNIVKGAILFPKNVIKGLADAAQWIGRGGKKLKAPTTELTVAAKRAKEAEDAYNLLEAARGNPKQFAAAVRKNPHIIDLHASHLATVRKTAQREAKHADDVARKKPVAPEVQHAEAPTTAKEIPTPAAKSPAELKPDFTMKKLTKERLGMLDRVKEALPGNKALKAVEQKLQGKEFTRLVRSLPDEEMRLLLGSLDELDSTIVERILKQEYKQFVENGEIVRLYVGETIGAGGFGIVSDCAFVKGTGGKLEVRAVKISRSLEPFKAEIEQIQSMLRDNKLTPEETGLTRKRINELHEKLKTEDLKPSERGKINKDIEKLERRLQEVTMSAETRADFGRRIAAINQHMTDFNLEFIREKNGLAMAKGMPGLLQVRHMSGSGTEHMIIINGIKPMSGEPVTWQKRIADMNIPVESTIDDLQTIVQALDNLHANGLIHGDFNGKQIFHGVSEGKQTVVLGDLALVPVDQFASGVGIKLTEPTISGRSVPVLKQLFDSSVTTTGSMSGTQKYFSYPHLKELVENLSGSAKEAKAAGRDATKLEISKDVVALGDNNALGITLLDQREIFAANRSEYQRAWGMDSANFDRLLADYDSIITRLTDPKQTVPYSDVTAQLEKAKQRIRRAKESSAEALPIAA